jgi:hypothetical protein
MMSLQSITRLGWSLVRVLAHKVVGRPAQLTQFLRQYQSAGIVPFSAEDEAVLRGAGRCIACGRCDQQALAGGHFAALGPRGPMAFVLGVSRHSGEHDAAQISPQATPAVLSELTAACPVEVPFAELAALVLRRKEALERIRGTAA